MGATCGTINCSGKKPNKYPKASIISRPTPLDYSVDEDNETKDERIVKQPDYEEARIGVYF